MKTSSIVKYYLLLLFVLISQCTNADNTIDSLKKALPLMKNDTQKVTILLYISNFCAEDEIELYASKAYELALQMEPKLKGNKLALKSLIDKKAAALNNLGYVYSYKRKHELALSTYKKAEQLYLTDTIYKKQLGFVYNNIAMVYQSMDDDLEALKFYNISLTLRLKINDVEGIPQTYENMATTYINMGDYNKALDFHYKALRYCDKYNLIRSKGYAYNGIGFILDKQGNKKEALANYEKAGECLKKGNDMQGLVANYKYMGIIFEEQKNLTKALLYYDSSYQIALKLDDIISMSQANVNKGDIYRQQGKTKEANESFTNAIAICNKQQNFSGLTNAYSSLASLYIDLKKYKDAEAQATLAKQYAFKTQKPAMIEESAFLLYRIQQKLGKYKDALENHILYTKMRDSIINSETQKTALKQQMKYEYDKKEALSKLEQEKKEIAYAAQTNKQRIMIFGISIGLLLVLIFAGFIYNRFKITQRQERIIKKSLEKIEILNNTGKEINSTLNLEKVMTLIYKNIREQMDVSFFIISSYNEEDQTVSVKYCVKDDKVVSENFTTSIYDPNSLTAVTIKNRSEVIILNLDTDYSKYLSGTHKLHGKEDAWCESIIMIPLFVQNKLIGLFSAQSYNKYAYTEENIELLRSLSSFISVALNNAESYNQLNSANVEILSQKHLIEEHQKETIDSITYAKRIQDAILPPINLIKEKLPESFLLYKPKDIVAGDFYWMEEIQLADDSISQLANYEAQNNQLINKSANRLILIAAADCTGHGVPGAMVSVVCSNALNRAVKEFKLTEPGEILDKVTDLVLETFEKSNEDVKDGMDISLLSIEFQKTKNNAQNTVVKWSGANNPLWYFTSYPEPLVNGKEGGKRDDYVFNEITADKQPIGKSDHRKPFTTHTITTPRREDQEGATTYYLFTDGYADQFGGPKGKKLKYKPFQESIVSVLDSDAENQKEYLETVFENWKGNLEQVDDVCVIGIRI